MTSDGIVVAGSRGDRSMALTTGAVRASTAAALLTAVVILVLRYPTSVLAPELIWEDGPIFYLRGFEGLASLVRPYQGYLHVGARMIAVLAASLPPAVAPLLMNGVAILVTAGVAAFIASDRLHTVVPDRRLRLALAAGFVLMPAAQDLSWHLVYMQWSLAFFLLARVLADAPSARWIWADRMAVAIAGLTGPFSIVFAPLYVWRRRQLGPVTWIVVACALVQLAVLSVSYRTPTGEMTAIGSIAVFATRLLVEPLIGYRLTAQLGGAGIPVILGAVFALGIAVLLAVAASAVPRRTLVVLLYGAVVVGAAGILRSADSETSLLAAWSGGRYFLFGIAAIGAIVIASVAVGGPWQRRAGIVLGAMLLFGVIVDFRVLAPPTLGWAEKSACVGGVDPCVVPVFPGGDWDLRWPGR